MPATREDSGRDAHATGIMGGMPVPLVFDPLEAEALGRCHGACDGAVGGGEDGVDAFGGPEASADF